MAKAKDPEAQKRKEEIKKADVRLLAQLGYKQEFKRDFKPIEVFGVSFSIIGLTPSIASVLFYSLPNGGGPAMVWGWLVASLLVLCVGMSMAELASAMPTSGGLYFWTYAFASPRCRKILCWIVGYANTIGNIAAVASIDWGCAVQVMAAVTIASPDFSPSAAQLFGVYTGIVMCHGVLCCLGTTILARLQTVYIILNVLLCMVVIIVLPITTPNEFRNTPSFALGDFTNFNGWPNGFAFILSFLAPLWTICSFDASVHIAEESSNASVAVPWGIVNAISVAGILGWAINMVLAFCMGTDLEALYDSDQPMALIFLNSFGKNATLGLWIVVVLVQFMMGSSMLLGASRQTFAFSRDGALPLSGWLYRINRYTGTPINSVWYDAVLAIAMGLLVFAGDQAINAAFALSVTGLYIAYAIPIICRFWGENDFKPGPFYLGSLSGACAIVSVSFMFFMSVVFLFPTEPTTTLGDMNYTVVVLGGVLALSLVWYYFPGYGGVHWFTGPLKTIEKGDPALELNQFQLGTQRTGGGMSSNSNSQFSATASSNYRN
ncbi:APC amino acid permease [Coprinellus micaceus]|uniref:APC amino acid permease n=1 Tax=Coprinellus micaceus TaxID=71717 RepID=A0A4Y7TJQ6_COPMI|nr:APC amino acid permease [Coprinellus micaceus]